MAERAKITWKGENPPRKLQTQKEEAFNVADFRKRANESLDDLKKKLYAQGVSPSAVSAQWQQARLLHDKILKNINQYQSERDADAKVALEKSLKESLSSLRGDVSENVLDGRSDVLLSRTKDKSRRKWKKDSLDKFERVIGSAMHEQTQEYLNPLQERQIVIRARLNELEEQEASNSGIKTNREPEVLALEQELRDVEIKIKEGKRIGNESTKSQTQSTPELKESHDTASDSVDPEHEVESDTVPSEEEQPRFNDGVRDAEFEDIVSDRRDLVPIAHTDQEDPERSNFYGKDSPDATPKEIRQKYRETVSRAEMEAVDKLNAQQESVREISRAYFAALKAEQKARGTGSKVMEDLTGHEGTKKETRLLRDSWIKARAEFALAQRTALDARLADRPKTREELLEGLKYKGRDSLDQAKVRARYERMITLRTIVMGAEEAERAVKMEGLSERDKTSFDRAFDQYKALPPSIRIFGTSAAILGLTTGAAVILGGSAIGLVPLGLAGASAALRFWAEKNNNKNAKQWIGGVSRITSIGGAFGALSNLAVTLGHRVAGTERKASELLAQNEGLGNLADEKNLKKLSKERKGALGVKESIARQGRLARILGSIGGGILFGHAFSNAHAPETVSLTGNHSISGADTGTSSALDASKDAVASSSSQPEGLLVGATIHHQGEGFGEMIQEMKRNFHAQLPTVDSLSPALAHVLNSNPNDLTHEILVAKDGSSLTMHTGDQFVADENQNIWFQPQGGEPQLVFENDPTAPGGFVHHDITGHMQVDGGVHHTASGTEQAATHHETPRVAEAQTPVAHPETPDEVTARLNTEGRMGHPIAPPEAPSDIDTPVSQDDVASTGDTPVHHDAPEAAPTPAPEQAQPVPPATAELPSTETPEQAPETGTPSAYASQEGTPTTTTSSAEPAYTPESVITPASGVEHPFAVLGATPDLNQNGVDLNQPQILLNEGRWFAHGTDNSDSYDRAVAFSQELSKTTNDSNVYFVTKEYDVFGREYLAVRMVFTPPGGGVSQMAPYAEGLNPSAQFVMPPLPKDADYQLPPK